MGQLRSAIRVSVNERVEEKWINFDRRFSKYPSPRRGRIKVGVIFHFGLGTPISALSPDSEQVLMSLAEVQPKNLDFVTA